MVVIFLIKEDYNINDAVLTIGSMGRVDRTYICTCQREDIRF